VLKGCLPLLWKILTLQRIPTVEENGKTVEGEGITVEVLD